MTSDECLISIDKKIDKGKSELGYAVLGAVIRPLRREQPKHRKR